jgi:hypothetical protein
VLPLTRVVGGHLTLRSRRRVRSDLGSLRGGVCAPTGQLVTPNKDDFVVTSHRGLLRSLCVAALVAAIGCSTSPPPPGPSDVPGSQAGALSPPTKELPKGAKAGKAKALIN